MIVVTGGAGFIGSCMVARLNALGHQEILVVDHLGHTDKWKNLRRLAFTDYLDKSQLFSALAGLRHVKAIIHMGACSDTTETDAQYLMENNYRFTMNLARHALHNDIRFIYASSAATYGSGDQGYVDDENALNRLQPLNMYGYSKHLFDLKAKREGWLSKIVGLKFFNVYGPNEYHKDNMCSVVYKAFHQIRDTGSVRLFKSHRKDFSDGGQRRDFIYAKQAVDIMAHLLEHPEINGLFNAGTGQARSFKALAQATFKAMDIEPSIIYIDMPAELRDRYQYYTQADMTKSLAAGIHTDTWDLESGIADYVHHYLQQDNGYMGHSTN